VSDPDLEELRQQTQRTDRLAEPDAREDGTEDLVEDLVEAIGAIDHGPTRARSIFRERRDAGRATRSVRARRSGRR